MNRFFFTQPLTKRAKMNRFTVLEIQDLLITSRESKRNEVHRGRSVGRAVKSASRGMFYVGTFRSLGRLSLFVTCGQSVRGTGE